VSRNTKGVWKGKKREVSVYLRQDIIERLDSMLEAKKGEGLSGIRRSDLVESACMLYLQTYELH
jgi:hypothetical protein